jgi:hypothetical protein
MRHFILYILTLCLISCGQSQTSKEKLIGNPQSDISLLLKEGKHTAYIMDGVKQSPKQAEITARLQKAMQENYTWFIDYMKTVPEGQPLPYHEKMNITKAEYEEYLKNAKNTEIVPSAKESLIIQKDGETISFKGTGRLVIFDSVKIDLSKNIVTFRGYQLPYVDSVRITNDKNGLKSKWFGYTFAFEQPKDISLEELKDLANLNLIKFKLTIGQLEKNKETYLDFSGRVVEDGEKKMDIRVPLVFE